jgi:hypothetical protein
LSGAGNASALSSSKESTVMNLIYNHILAASYYPSYHLNLQTYYQSLYLLVVIEVLAALAGDIVEVVKFEKIMVVVMIADTRKNNVSI